MSNKVHRRDFLTRLTVTLSSIFAFSVAGFSNLFRKSESISQYDQVKLIKRVKALGFQWKTQDPFLFCVHHEDKYPNGNKYLGPDCSLEGRDLGQDFLVKDGFRMYHGKKVPGFPGHPHRGFETITVVREGLVDHADSLGAAGRYGNGDVQWMTAGQGVQHSEMFPLLKENEENPLELFQIWLNLPSKNKFVPPHFKMLWREKIPIVNKLDENGINTTVEVVAGKFNGKQAQTSPPDSWAFPFENHVAIWNIKIDPNGKWILPKTEKGVNRTLYFYKGDSIKIGESEIPFYHSVTVKEDSDIIIENGNHISKLLLLQGKPINEPVVQHGPMVMNTKAEIQQAFADYQRTKFGGWPWPRRDQVHDKTQGRFAKHANGKVENMG